MRLSPRLSRSLLLAMALLALLGSTVLVGCRREKPTPTATPTASAGLANGAVRPVSHAEPSIKNLEEGFQPHTIFVAAGANVTWHNDDGVTHNVTSTEGWFQADIAPGEAYTWQATAPGTYRFFCDIHDKPEGVIIVEAGAAVARTYYDGKPVAKYFADSCGGCHGANREGAVGPALVPGRLTSSDDFYFGAIKDGRPGTIMPGWSDLGLTDEEIWGLVGFLRSSPKAEALEWELPHIAGSLEPLVDEAALPGSPQHSGNMDNLFLVTEREARRIAAIDGDTNALLGHIDASYRAHGYAFDPTNERWAYNVGRDGWVFKIDLYTLQATRKVRVGLDSRGIAISDDGRYLIVGNYIPTTAVILDAKTLKPLHVIHARGADVDGNVVDSRVAITSDVSPDAVGPYFIIALKEAGQLWRIDWSKEGFPVDKVERVGRILHDGFLSPDNRYFYLASQTDNWMAVIDVARWEVVDKISTGETPHPGSGAVWSADGRTYGATVHAGEGKVTVWDLETNEIAGTVKTTGPGLFLRAQDNSPYVWADALFGKPSNTVTVFEKEAPFDVVGVIEEGVMTLHPEFTADGAYVYISDWTGNTVRVYDATTLEKVAELTDIPTPTGIFNTHRRKETLGH